MIGRSETARYVVVSINVCFIRDSSRSAKTNQRKCSPLQQEFSSLVRLELS